MARAGAAETQSTSTQTTRARPPGDLPCGLWTSPLSPESVAAELGGPSWASVVGAEMWWCASRTTDATVKLLRWRADGAHASAVDVLGGTPLEADEFYRRVSPMFAVKDLRSPFVMMHGLDDIICRLDQSERFVTAARTLHGEHVCRAYLEFPGEGHGFRQASTLAAALEAELALFTEIMVLR